MRTIAIPVVKNVTTRTDLTYALTNGIVDEFSRSKIYDVVATDQAGAVLQASVVAMAM